MGPIRLRSYFNSMRFARYFVGFHVLVGLIGGGLICFGGSARDLGMAMVVGALFGLGAYPISAPSDESPQRTASTWAAMTPGVPTSPWTKVTPVVRLAISSRRYSLVASAR